MSKDVRIICEVFAGVMVALFAAAIMDKEPTAAAIYVALACWLIYKD